MKRTFVDQMNRSVEIHFPPKRIISLVPSQTELLYDLQLNHEIIGQTLFCVHPKAMHNSKPRVGGTKKLNFEKIAALNPDLIIGNKEENDQSQMEELMMHYPVWMSDIQHLNDALEMIRLVGELVDRKALADELANAIGLSFSGFRPDLQAKALYLIWKKPWMAAGAKTFIGDLLQRLGFSNAIKDSNSRYPELTEEQIALMQPEVILLSSEPYPFKDKHIDELKQICPTSTIMRVDGEMFSWYGSRLVRAVPYFQTLLKQLNG